MAAVAVEPVVAFVEPLDSPHRALQGTEGQCVVHHGPEQGCVRVGRIAPHNPRAGRADRWPPEMEDLVVVAADFALGVLVVIGFGEW